jgi:transcriptional regulator with XRE-family HTH domain
LNRPDLLTVTETSGLDQAGVIAVVRAAGELIRDIRMERGLVQADVARECGVTGSTLCRIERGNRDSGLSLWLGLCAVLGVRHSAVLRLAEDEAFPIGPVPWRYDVALPLDHASRLVPLDRASFLRGDSHSGS